ncbi:LytTR family DNA-binding domain-containing protein [Isobaculum melis]
MKIITANPLFEKEIQTKLKDWEAIPITLIDQKFYTKTDDFAMIASFTQLPDLIQFFNTYLQVTRTEKRPLLGKKYDRLKLLKEEDILYIEAIGRDVYAYTQTDGFLIQEKLYQLEEQPAFIRINKSTVVNFLKIVTILPLLNGKLLLALADGQELEVSRSYAKTFKHYLKTGGTL